jgi:hypothetical protein
MSEDLLPGVRQLEVVDEGAVVRPIEFSPSFTPARGTYFPTPGLNVHLSTVKRVERETADAPSAAVTFSSYSPAGMFSSGSAARY